MCGGYAAVVSGWDAKANASTNGNIASHLAGAATRAYNNGDNYNSTIPSHLKIWVLHAKLN